MRPLTISADAASEDLRDALVDRLGLTPAATSADIVIATGPPLEAASHVIVTGPLTDEVDQWDAGVPAQTVAGALWLVPDQDDPNSAALAWLLLRLQSPATPLSDLTDGNDRALRWSVVAATTITGSPTEPAAVDDNEVAAWVDAQPEVQELGSAVERLGGETGDAVLTSVQRFRAALEATGGQPGPAFDAAVADHLREVQRSGFGRWRGAKARAGSAAALQQTAREAAGDRVRQLLTQRAAEVAAQAGEQAMSEQQAALHGELGKALDALTVPVQPDFGKVPRSWADAGVQARRYVFVSQEDEIDVDVDATIRPCEQLSPGTAVCALVQSGFSLPALR